MRKQQENVSYFLFVAQMYSLYYYHNTNNNSTFCSEFKLYKKLEKHETHQNHLPLMTLTWAIIAQIEFYLTPGNPTHQII